MNERMPSLRFAIASAILAITQSFSCHAFTTEVTSSTLQQQQLQTLPKLTVVFSHDHDKKKNNNNINYDHIVNYAEAEQYSNNHITSSRRSFMTLFAAAVSVAGVPLEADAAADCFKDCFKNCKLIAPKDPQYCQNNCQEYCAQSDRTDGLSGSVSSEGGEVGILGINTVPKGEDKPPEVKLPGLDFTSGKGKKLLGY